MGGSESRSDLPWLGDLSEGKKRKNYRAIFGIGGVDFTEQKVTI